MERVKPGGGSRARYGRAGAGRDEARADHDYVIVGAGSAGCVLASRLSEDPGTSVLLLEAGPADRDLRIRIPAAFSGLFKTRYDWDYRTVPQEHLGGRRLYWPRGRVLGGCSSMNAQVHVRGHRTDFDGWASGGADGWSWDDVLPYFRRSEDAPRPGSSLRGVDGPTTVRDLRSTRPATDAFVEAAVRAGIPRCADANGLQQEGVDFTQVTQRRGRRWSAADAYLRPAGGRKNLHVRTGALATRVLVEGDRAVGVEFRTGRRLERAYAGGEVILAAGAVNSPQLLMLSGVGPAAHLREHGIPVVRDLPAVGRHLKDHLAAGMVVRTRGETLDDADSLWNLLLFVIGRRGRLTSNVAEALAFLRSGPDQRAPDVELVFAPTCFLNHGLDASDVRGLTIGAVVLQPNSEGRITLRSAEPGEPPVIDPRYLSDPPGEDLRTLQAGIDWARRIFRTDPLRRFVAGPLEPESGDLAPSEAEAFVRRRAQTLYHPVGTCRMGEGEETVVDAALRVRGVGGLRVVDASVMPEIVRGHTHWATVMIAEKASDMIRDSSAGQASV